MKQGACIDWYLLHRSVEQITVDASALALISSERGCVLLLRWQMGHLKDGFLMHVRGKEMRLRWHFSQLKGDVSLSEGADGAPAG
jgi:hypothetical protein